MELRQDCIASAVLQSISTEKPPWTMLGGPRAPHTEHKQINRRVAACLFLKGRSTREEQGRESGGKWRQKKKKKENGRKRREPRCRAIRWDGLGWALPLEGLVPFGDPWLHQVDGKI